MADLRRQNADKIRLRGMQSRDDARKYLQGKVRAAVA